MNNFLNQPIQDSTQDINVLIPVLSELFGAMEECKNAIMKWEGLVEEEEGEEKKEVKEGKVKKVAKLVGKRLRQALTSEMMKEEFVFFLFFISLCFCFCFFLPYLLLKVHREWTAIG